MRIAGIICEYNPFHNGHAHQLAVLREAGYAPVCVMSGDYVQRGEPAVIPAAARAEAAVRCGAALVLELPPSYALRSAEGFADGGVELLDRLGCAEALCFGSESGDAETLLATAQTLLSPELVPLLKQELAGGASFPAARQRALERLGAPGAALPAARAAAAEALCPGAGAVLRAPNDILGVEYCKALLRRGSAMRPTVLHRAGDYHGGSAADAPSASFLRGQADWTDYMPEAARAVQAAAPRYRLAAGERAVLARLRAMGEDEFAALPYGSEGLWQKVMHACRTEASLEGILAAAKSKRYPRTRLMRMLLCAFLGLTAEDLAAEAPYVRILGFRDRGRQALREMSSRLPLAHAGQGMESPYFALEQRCERLYGLFGQTLEAPELRERVARL